MEFSNHHIPALICSSCVKQLNEAIKLRTLCIQSDNFFKKSESSYKAEIMIWKEINVEDSDLKIKKEHLNNHGIKEELIDDSLSISIFENIETIIDDNSIGSSHPQNKLSTLNREEETNSTSESDDEVKYHKSKKSLRSNYNSLENCKVDTSNNIARCRLCMKTFTSLHSMKSHMRTIHQKLDETDMFKCKYCDRLFKMKYYLSEYKNSIL